MVQTNELRIGNLIYISWKNAVNRSVREVDLGSIMDLASNGSGSAFNYEPIPLTEEWLLKFGFNIEKLPEYNKSVKNKIVITYGDNFFYGVTRLIYVHQLQNLYFALTNEELTLKL